MEEFRYVACAPPSCSCPELEVEKNIEEEPVVYITDDFGSVVQLSPSQMFLLATEFIKYYDKHYPA